MKEKITEEMKVHEKWFEEAKKQTVETIPEFIRHLTENYIHDYGTICQAIVAAGLAGMHAVENSPTGGITGFQAGCCMWGIVREWMYENNTCGLRLMDYDKILYPQYEHYFNSISQGTLAAVKKEAEKKILEHNDSVSKWEKDHAEWESKMKKFKVDVVEWQKAHPEHPTYEENPEYYNHLSCGNQSEWEEEHRKIESGFMFAPEEPCCPTVHEDVMAHWKAIVDGMIPFGLEVEED